MQSDGLHPNSEAQPRLLENVWESLQDLLAPAAAVVTEAG
jgi:acyl-CoA thioesterase-1